MPRHDPALVRRVEERAREQLAALDLDAFAAVGVARRSEDYNLVVHYLPTETMEPEQHEAARAAIRSPADDVALYLHVPACTGRCSYCHYAIVVNPDDGELDRYLAALKRELAARAGNWRSVGSVLLGGGTPTYLSAAQLDELLAALRAAVHLPDGIEFTGESSPETLDAEKLAVMLAAGVDRLNIGVQSFNPELLKTLARRHDPELGVASMELARASGMPHLNIDLMFALPGQSLSAWIEDLLTAAELQPESITTYHLRKRPETGISRFASPEDHRNLLMRIAAADVLTGRGYRESLPDNFCRVDQPTANRQTRDKWRDMAPTEGVGLAACSRRRDAAAMNEESIPRYVERVGAGECPPLASCKPLSEDDQLRQRTMFALKVLDDDGGALLETCEREFGVTMDAAFGPILAELEGVGLLEREPDRVRLSPVGRLFADEVLERFYTAEMLARIRGRMSVRELPTRPPSRTT